MSAAPGISTPCCRLREGGCALARDFDAQLLESVAVRRQRLRDALLHGLLHARRSTNENVKRGLIGVVLAAVACAGCVGWSFLSHQMARQQQQVGVVVPPATPSGPN